jgi:uncharacterized protein
MQVTINLRHLEAANVRLEGEVPAEELDIDNRDRVIRVTHPLEYRLEAQKVEEGILLQGRLRLLLECECVRCLKPFLHEVKLESWARHLPLAGEEAVRVANDCVDALPPMREDILLDFPQHPVCNPACRGLPKASPGKAQQSSGLDAGGAGSAAWAELNKLKL